MMSTPVADNIVPGKTSEPCESPPSKRRLLSDSTLTASDLSRYKSFIIRFICIIMSCVDLFDT